MLKTTDTNTPNTPTEKKKAGRPRIKFTAEQIAQIDEYALLNAKNNTIAVKMGIDINTFEKHFKKKCEQKRAEGKIALHKAQDNLKNTPVMAIWLGKQHLEQSDKNDVKHGADGALSAVLSELAGKQGRLVNEKGGE
jgi:hypothetical protein